MPLKVATVDYATPNEISLLQEFFEKAEGKNKKIITFSFSGISFFGKTSFKHRQVIKKLQENNIPYVSVDIKSPVSANVRRSCILAIINKPIYSQQPITEENQFGFDTNKILGVKPGMLQDASAISDGDFVPEVSIGALFHEWLPCETELKNTLEEAARTNSDIDDIDFFNVSDRPLLKTLRSQFNDSEEFHKQLDVIFAVMNRQEPNKFHISSAL